MKPADSQNTAQGRRRRSSRGVALVTFTFATMILMGTSGMAVDLAYLYTARAEAQRAADAAALAAANDFANSGYTSGLLSAGQVENLAAADAAAVGNTNLILGASPEMEATTFADSCPLPAGADGCFDLSVPNDPRVTVIAQRTTAHGNPLPLFFMKMFGIPTADVSAAATAEAYNPSSSGGPPINMQNLKPWLTPNCDPKHVVASTDSRANPNCQADTNDDYSYIIYPPGSANAGQVVFPGQDPAGVVGEQFILKPGSPSQAPAPSQFYPIYLPQSYTSVCPAGASTSTSSNGGGSASLYEQNIECWTPQTYTCGQQSISIASGNMVGPTSSGVDVLIHQGSDGTGQDILDLSLVPFEITAGANNPYYSEGQVVTSSDSVVVVPLYDGSNLCPGGSCSSTVDVQGFLQVFIAGEYPPSGTVTSYVMNAGGCGNQQPGAVSVDAWANPVVVRLIHD
jgi:Putative Flp pilus-assembly TadE/G-like